MSHRRWHAVPFAIAFLLGSAAAFDGKAEDNKPVVPLQLADSSTTTTPAAGVNTDTPYKIQADGTVDWYTYSGYRRYHSECHVCHGPDGEGSTYAPALKDSVKSMSYADFTAVYR